MVPDKLEVHVRTSNTFGFQFSCVCVWHFLLSYGCSVWHFLLSYGCRGFASGIGGKLSEMLDQTSVPLDVKLKLVSIFEHMTFDPDNYEKVCVFSVLCLLHFTN